VRKFYLAMAYPSLFAYSVAELKLSADAAYKRIKAARAARRFPVILEAVSDGRLNLSSVCLLAPHLVEGTASELLAAAMNKSNDEIEKLLAERFPRPDVREFVAPIPLASPAGPAAAFINAPVPESTEQSPTPPAPTVAVTLQAARPVDLAERSIVKPLAPQRYEIHFSMSESCHEKLRHLQDLLGFDRPPGDLGRLFEDALDARIREVEKQKFAATSAPQLSLQREPALHPRPREAHGLGTRWRAVHVHR